MSSEVILANGIAREYLVRLSWIFFSWWSYWFTFRVDKCYDISFSHPEILTGMFDIILGLPDVCCGGGDNDGGDNNGGEAGVHVPLKLIDNHNNTLNYIFKTSYFELYFCFYRFPKNSDTCKLWLDILGIQVSVSNRACICSTHFGEQFFDRSGVRVRLRPNTLPNANTMEKENLSSNSDPMPLKLSANNATRALSPNIVQYSASAMEGGMACSNDNSTSTKLRQLSPQPSTSTELCQISPQPSIKTELCQLSTQPSTSKEHKATMVSPMFIYNSPEKCRLRKRIKFLHTRMKMKMQAMHQKLRRKSKQVLTLKSVLQGKDTMW
ncbi:uncharacterized protein LOC143367214 [Andrena cerasifolii]|uniref:uncharacterized protein LOC143367214 n=1 Tax=Andrena cerasifolii TaxID=2819439 RepID=UPI004037F336